MNRSIFTGIVALAFSGASIAGDNMTGQWDCKMVSEYGDFQFVLTLNDDSTYTNKQDMFGEVNVDAGKWTVEGKELVMNRETFTTNGKEKASSHQFRRNIVSVSDTTLVLKHDETVTTCSRT